MRDLGGLATVGSRRVRRGRVFRAGALHALEHEDVAVLAALGIRRVFDLRSAAELARDGVGPVGGGLGRHVHVPLVRISLDPFDPDIDWRNVDLQHRYLEMLREGGEAIRRIFGALAEPDASPLIFHCSGGKDRTGVVAALILRALGVGDDAIVGDYAMSEKNLASLRRVHDELDKLGLSPDVVAYLTSSPPGRMRYTLQELDRRWGSTFGYLESVGVTRDVLAGLERNLLEPSDA